MTIVKNEKDEFISTRAVMDDEHISTIGSLTKPPLKDHYSLPFIDLILERLTRIPSLVISMGIWISSKSLSIQMI